MDPTLKYLASPEITRSRSTFSNGSVHVITENFSVNTQEHSDIYLSQNQGQYFILLNWKIYWLSWLKKPAWQWPPNLRNTSSIEITNNNLSIKYIETTYDGADKCEIKYFFAKKKWYLIARQSA